MVYLSPYAVKYWQTRGRLHRSFANRQQVTHADLENRTAFQRDRDRIIHARAFRRLKHKTQVVSKTIGDHHRTRLTHSLEVAQIARSIARVLFVDIDLTEAVALVHDIGHPPFGHAGEDVLSDKMADWGGFDHNDQAVRIVTQLEVSYPDFDGLNLSFETLDSIVKHNGPVLKPKPNTQAISQKMDINLRNHGYFEAQIAAISDDIAYNYHDLDDGLQMQFFSLEKTRQSIAYLDRELYSIKAQYPDIDQVMMRRELIRRLIHASIQDLLIQTRKNLKEQNIFSSDDVQQCDMQLVQFSPLHALEIEEMHQFLMKHMYLSARVMELREKGSQMLSKVFDHYMECPHLLPSEWQRDKNMDEALKARHVCDYIAGMSDVFLEAQYLDIFGNG
ncbi:MAG: dGTP triphosphohydrolase [Pseudomonadota bacterium]